MLMKFMKFVTPFKIALIRVVKGDIVTMEHANVLRIEAQLIAPINVIILAQHAMIRSR